MIFHNYVPYAQQLNSNKKKSRSVFAVGIIILSRVSVSIRTVSQSGRFCVSKGKIKHHPLSFCKEAEGCEKNTLFWLTFVLHKVNFRDTVHACCKTVK